MKRIISILILAFFVSGCSMAIRVYYLNKYDDFALLITKPSIEFVYGKRERTLDFDSIELKRINPYTDSLGMYRIKTNEKILLYNSGTSYIDKFPFKYIKIIQRNDTIMVNKNNFENKIKRYKGNGGRMGVVDFTIDDK
jgi:hypothetical protein